MAKSTLPLQIQQVTRPLNLPSIYVEGISQMSIGFPNSRFTMYSLNEKDVPGNEGTEVRHISCELVMPTTSLLELAKKILEAVGQNKATILEKRAEWEKLSTDLFDSIPPVEAAKT